VKIYCSGGERWKKGKDRPASFTMAPVQPCISTHSQVWLPANPWRESATFLRNNGLYELPTARSETPLNQNLHEATTITNIQIPYWLHFTLVAQSTLTPASKLKNQISHRNDNCDLITHSKHVS
jgi:hypothetical protein